MRPKDFAGMGAWLCLSMASGASAPAWGDAAQAIGAPSMDTVKHLADYQAVEFRRYTLANGVRPQFVSYFEAFFPETFEQLGAITFGSFVEHANSTGFVEIRGFHALVDRAVVSSEFYYGPVWREHRGPVNEMLAGDDSVMLMKPLDTQSSVVVLPSVDPRVPATAQSGTVIAEIFSVKKGSEDEFGKRADAVFARYLTASVRQAGILVTLDAPNNFPQQEIRSDGPFLIWLGVA